MNDPAQMHFIVSTPRSGSTWLATALNYHPDVFATEQRLFGQFCEIWENPNGKPVPRITVDKFAEGFAGHYFFQFINRRKEVFVREFKRGMINFLVRFAQVRSKKPVMVDKVTPYPGTTELVLTEIKQFFPESKIIHLVRDGRDVLTSGAFDWLNRNQGTDRYKFFCNPVPGMKLERFFDDKIIQTWASEWAESAKVFAETPPDYRVTYEALNHDMAMALEGVLETLGVSFRESLCLECEELTTFERMTGRSVGTEAPLEKKRKGIVGDWKNYFTKADAIRFNELAGDQLLALGYETDDSWIDELPEVLKLVRESGLGHA